MKKLSATKSWCVVPALIAFCSVAFARASQAPAAPNHGSCSSQRWLLRIPDPATALNQDTQFAFQQLLWRAQFGAPETRNVMDSVFYVDRTNQIQLENGRTYSPDDLRRIAARENAIGTTIETSPCHSSKRVQRNEQRAFFELATTLAGLEITCLSGTPRPRIVDGRDTCEAVPAPRLSGSSN